MSRPAAPAKWISKPGSTQIDADVLAGGLGAVARAAGHRHLDLGRRPGPPMNFSMRMPSPVRILRAEAAPVGTDAGLHRAQPLGIGLPGDEAGLAEVGPARPAGLPS